MSDGLSLLALIIGFGSVAAAGIILYVVWYSPSRKQKRASRARKRRSSRRHKIDLCAPAATADEHPSPGS